MKIGVWVKEGIDFKRGGAFSYQSKLLELIDDYKFSSNLELSFITSDVSFQSRNKEVIRINNIFADDSAESSSLEKYSLKVPILGRLLKKQKKSHHQKRISDIKKVLSDHSVDVVYYLTQGGRLVPDYPFISTNWDVGHMSTYMFPEFCDPKSRNNRIHWYNYGINNALAVFVESESGKKELVKYLNINPSRVMVVPMFPGDIIGLSIAKQEQHKILESFDLVEQKFFFYPAQFWAHKNHYNLIKAFKGFNTKYPDIKLVLTGSDVGRNLDYILSLIRDEEVKGVIHLGFVGQKVLYTLYKNAIALVMPTFLGPTNMPPLEAVSLGCPVICSDLVGHREQLQEAAIFINPLDQEHIYEALVSLMHDDIRKNLRRKGEDLLRITNFTQDFAIRALEINFNTISKYRSTWDK